MTEIDLRAQLGLILYHQSKYEDALKEFNLVYETCSNDVKRAIAIGNRGLTHFYLKDYKKAISDLSEALLFEPSVAQYYALRAASCTN